MKDDWVSQEGCRYGVAGENESEKVIMVGRVSREAEGEVLRWVKESKVLGKEKVEDQGKRGEIHWGRIWDIRVGWEDDNVLKEMEEDRHRFDMNYRRREEDNNANEEDGR